MLEMIVEQCMLKGIVTHYNASVVCKWKIHLALAKESLAASYEFLEVSLH
jgi:hypothetical protein